jgi:Coenzyme PQQ synthesis protein D (PqqD)
MAETRSITSDQVICTEFDGGEGILVDLKTKRYFELNETALLVWKQLEKGGTLDEIVTEVVTGYDVPPNHARQSVDNLIERLRSYKLVSDSQWSSRSSEKPAATQST